MRGDLNLASVLDDAFELLARGAPAAAAWMVITALPLRFLEARLVWALIDLGPQAMDHAGYLLALSAWTTLALVPAFWGRAAYARACSLALQGDVSERAAGSPGSAFRPFAGLRFARYAAGLHATLWIWVLAPLLGWTIAALPLLALAGGFAAVTTTQLERPRVWNSLVAMGRALSPLRLTLGIAFSALAAWFVACVNLGFLFTLGRVAAEGVLGFELPWWRAALSPENPLFVLLLGAGGWLLVEPLWLGALASVVHRARATTTGEDLTAWFAEVRRAAPRAATTATETVS